MATSPAASDGLRLRRHRHEHDARARRRRRTTGASPRCCSERAFTRLGQGLTPGARSRARRSTRSPRVVAEQVALARERAAPTRVRVVATAAIRGGASTATSSSAIARAAASTSRSSTATRRRGWRSSAPRARSARAARRVVGVVDVGGGSTEIAIGTVARRRARGARRSASAPACSPTRYLRSDPPSRAELRAVRDARHRRVRRRSTCPAADVRGRGRRQRRLAAPRWSATCSSRSRSSARSACSAAAPRPTWRRTVRARRRARAAAAGRHPDPRRRRAAARQAAADRPRRPARGRAARHGDEPLTQAGHDPDGRNHRDGHQHRADTTAEAGSLVVRRCTSTASSRGSSSTSACSSSPRTRASRCSSA